MPKQKCTTSSSRARRQSAPRSKTPTAGNRNAHHMQTEPTCSLTSDDIPTIVQQVVTALSSGPGPSSEGTSSVAYTRSSASSPTTTRVTNDHPLPSQHVSQQSPSDSSTASEVDSTPRTSAHLTIDDIPMLVQEVTRGLAGNDLQADIPSRQPGTNCVTII